MNSDNQNTGISKGGSPVHTRLLMTYKQPFTFSQVLSFLRPRAIKGVEIVDDHSYSRTFQTDRAPGYFIVTDKPDQSALELSIHCDDINCYTDMTSRISRMFDLNTDLAPINDKFRTDAILSRGMTNGSVPRLPIAFDPFEFCVRAILGQQISVQAATTLASRIAERTCLETRPVTSTGVSPVFPPGLDYFFPGPEEILAAGLEGIGITRSRQATILEVARGLMENRFSLDANQPFDAFETAFSSIRGIGEWTVHYVAMRGLGMRDSFPATDLGILKALETNGNRPSKKAVLEIAEKWRPFRAYAALCLWNQ